MSADNVTPIRPKPPQALEPKKPRMRRARPRDGCLLADPPEGPSTLRVIQALHGVC
jgi:hypothetical protein